MGNKEKKTNVMRYLDQKKISYWPYFYEVIDGEFDGVEVANRAGLAPEEVFKTLVVQNDDNKRDIAVCIVSVDKHLDLKKLAAVRKIKKASMLHINDLLATTGYIRGGCSPIGMKKAYPTYLDELALACENIAVSAGLQGTQVYLDPKDLIQLTSAIVAQISGNNE